MRSVLALLMLSVTALAQAAELHDVRVWDGPESTRVVFDLGGAAEYQSFTLENPDRLVIDIRGAHRQPGLKLSGLAKGMVKSVRTGPRDDGLRIVLDLTAPVAPKSFSLEPNGQYGRRLIFDLFAAQPLPEAAEAVGPPRPLVEPVPASPLPPPPVVPTPAPETVVATKSASHKAPESVPAAPVVTAMAAPVSDAYADVQVAKVDRGARSLSMPSKSNTRPLIIAIDAGHGGEDPGARSRGGIIEKELCLRIARRLQTLVNATPGYRAVMTREGDYFVPLRERTAIARRAQADLFISIHANSLPTIRDVRGAAVYVLSERGASNEHAKMLARLENEADLVGGVALSGKDDDLASVLLDISQTAVREASFDLGSRLLHSLGNVNILQKPVVQQAGFAVLKAPDIPSALVETAFLSHPEDERLLASDDFQDGLAQSLLDGIQGYFATYRPITDLPNVPVIREVKLSKPAAPKAKARTVALKRSQRAG